MTTPFHRLSRSGHVVRAGVGVWLAAALGIATLVGVAANGPRFYSDDPIAREPESQDASGAQPEDIGLMFELSYNLFVTANHTPSNTRAGNANTIDEVPDSGWFTNRIAAGEVTAAEIARGPNIGAA